MNYLHRIIVLIVIGSFFVTVFPGHGIGAEWSIPLAGNAFRTEPGPGGGGFQRNRPVRWSDPDEVFSIFFHLDRPAVLDLSLRARSSIGRSALHLQVSDESFDVVVEDAEMSTRQVGRVSISAAGYVRADVKRADLRDVGGANPSFIEIEELVVASDTEDLKLAFVGTNDGNMFYWGRRGPSVHLRYDVPKERRLRYAYSEVTVPPGEDPVGSFYMANGFGEGYFGIQVNGPDERRVLFSVWSPYRTDNPREIPENQRIACLAKGPEVRVGEFGNEGSGGQSFLRYPWQAGTTYRFLTEVRPDGEGNTIYTAWFGDKSVEELLLIATFRRPQTDTHLRGFHSFLENFSPNHGHIGRHARYGNIWVRDVEEGWHECLAARFSVDATGGGRHRLDFNGGSEHGHFVLRNCGFFNETGRPGVAFRRDASVEGPPKIEFDSLPRE